MRYFTSVFPIQNQIQYLSKKLASQHILRVVAKDIPVGYLFAFMNSEIGLNSIQSFMYGSVIQQIEPHHLELLPIPILNENLMNKGAEALISEIPK